MSWLTDIFSDDTFKTVVDGFNTAGSIFNAASPLINRGAQLALGVEGTRNAQNNIAANQQALDKLNDMFSPTGDYAKELRNQLERKDAAAGRRSQYGTRETELMTALAKQKAAVLTSPAYQNYINRSTASPYAPLGGAVGNITTQQGAQGGQRTDANGNKIPNVPTSTAQYLANLFGPGAEASIASLGGAGSALAGANTPAALGVVDELGSMFGNPYLPGYADTATGIFGGAPGAAAGAGDATGGYAGSNLGGAIGSGLDWLGGSGAFGGAGSALSGMGSGSLAGTVGGSDVLGSMFGGTGFLPGYTSTGASSLFGGAGTGAAAGEAAMGGGAGAGAAATSTPWLAAGATALPFLLAAGGMLNGIFGQADNGTPITQANDAWANAIAKDPSLLQKYGQGDISKYMQGMFGGEQWTPEQYNKATNMLSAASGGGSFFGNALGNAEQGMGG